MLETYRRTELIVFLLNNAENDPLKQKPLLQTANCFKINQKIIDFKIEKGRRKSLKDTLNVFSRTMLKQIDSRDYLMAYKVGFLLKKGNSFYKSWETRFYVLCSIGLVHMEKPNQKDVKLFPFQDFQVQEIPYEVHKKPHVFEIKTTKGGSFDFTLQAASPKEYEEWLAAFKKFHAKF